MGFYLSGAENDFELCFRKLASLLQEHTPLVSSAEDKNVYEIFGQRTEPGRLSKPRAVAAGNCSRGPTQCPR